MFLYNVLQIFIVTAYLFRMGGVMENATNGNSLLVLTNAIVMLGHVAIELKETHKTTESVLHFLQQRVGKMPPVLDILIVDQLACIVIAKCEVSSQRKASTDGVFYPCLNTT